MTRMKKPIAILLAVLFLVSLTASAVSAEKNWPPKPQTQSTVLTSILRAPATPYFDTQGKNMVGSTLTFVDKRITS